MIQTGDSVCPFPTFTVAIETTIRSIVPVPQDSREWDYKPIATIIPR
jgi:hypothetical protein